MTLDKYLRRPKSKTIVHEGRYERLNLRENPFPASPFVNPYSSDRRSNGEIYEPSIRFLENQLIRRNFLEASQTDPNHLRLGYIIDTSYVGRGNGKSAFLVNLQKEINQDFGFTLSSGQNKCFALTLVPEPGGKTKTFERFVDLFASGIFEMDIIDDALAALRLEALLELHEDFPIQDVFTDEAEIRLKLNSDSWYSQNRLSFRQVNDQIVRNPHLQSLPPDFPIYVTGLFNSDVPNQERFRQYYAELKRGKPKQEFIFSHLVNLFIAAGFNGAYIFVDDFERIPDFQSERQKRDFALELRTTLFDGMYTNAKIGFYNFILVLHAGVPRLIQSAWDQSGLEQRAPISPTGNPKHVIRFEKITLEHAYALVFKYLQEFRITPTSSVDYSPFSKSAIRKIAELSEFNTSRILKMAYEMIERAIAENSSEIDVDFIMANEDSVPDESKKASGIHDTPTKDLLSEAK